MFQHPVFVRGTMYLNIPTNNIKEFIDSHQELQHNKIFQNGSMNREKRDGSEYHLTIIEPQEMKSLTKNNTERIYDKIKDSVDLSMIGIGSVTNETSSCIYIICISEQLNEFRRELGLKDKDLHITLGFTNTDIHATDKSINTMIMYNPNTIIDMMTKIKIGINYYPLIHWFLETNDQRFEKTQKELSLKLIDSLEFGHHLHHKAVLFLINKEFNYLIAMYYESKYFSKSKQNHAEVHCKFADMIRKQNLIIRDSDETIVEKTLNILNFPLVNNVKWLYELGSERSRTYYWYEYNGVFKWYESPRNFSFVTDNLCGSSIPDKEDNIDFFHHVGINHIITLMETPLSDTIQKKIKSFRIKYSFFSIDDRKPPTFDQMTEIISLIQNNGKVLVHCKGGVGRTATILIAYLVTIGKSRDDSTLILQKRKTILSDSQEDFLKEWTNRKFNNLAMNNKKHAKIKLPQLIMLVGLPASGKTTFSKTIEDQIINIQRINQDEIRTKGKCEELFSKYTKTNQTVILDRCNLTINERKYWLDLNNHSERNCWCIYFVSNPEECKWRIKNRKNHPTVTDANQGIGLITSIGNTLQAPTINEGFSHIETIESFKDANNLLLKIGCCIDDLIEVNHDQIIKFPRTRHLYNLGAVQRDDLMVPADEIQNFLKCQIYLEEKIDGANLGISIKNYKLVAQNRSHFVNSSYHPQFKCLDKWLIDHSQDLWEILQDETKILYGEWVYAKHSIYYTELPDYFIAYDIWDAVEKRFYSRRRLEETLGNLSIKFVPLIYSGSFDSVNDILKYVILGSKFYDGPIEGIYIRVCDNMWLKERAKIVRNDFLSGNEHWTKNIMTINKIKPITSEINIQK